MKKYMRNETSTHTKKLENHLEIKRSEKLEHTKKKTKR